MVVGHSSVDMHCQLHINARVSIWTWPPNATLTVADPSVLNVYCCHAARFLRLLLLLLLLPLPLPFPLALSSALLMLLPSPPLWLALPLLVLGLALVLLRVLFGDNVVWPVGFGDES